MYTLRYPDEKVGDPFDVLKSALGVDVPADLKRKLSFLYFAYCERKGVGCNMIAARKFRLEYGSKLRAAYKTTYTNKPLSWLRKELRSVAGNRCPSCGGARPVTLDHHLAQNPFPEFAIFPLNLVAMCGTCNQRKSATTGKAIETSFIHPYLDEVPEVPFFTATVIRDDGTYTVCFEFTPDAIPDAELSNRMSMQLKKVDFNEALLPEVGELLAEWALRIEDEIVIPNEGEIDQWVIKDYLNRNATRIEKQHRVGFWQAIMSRALADDAQFCSGGFRDLLPRSPS
ncbi:hypothetical protein LX81_03979 [Palleronia aestuarii]|uniref:HNH endonuclease n=1 Tax=Palleronia aestuarii TaxID=568105 RepID=A0A2W7MYT5_9RHOB|nr:hypothetical protein [Palleronia aestuarii]PZX11307.1 hypothetical protein LX81_03979 [Palleronia aestuarii]